MVLFSPIYTAVIYLCYQYLWGYGVTTDHLLAIIILFQTYIIWIQVEIAMRQTAVFKTEYDATFKPIVDSVLLGDSLHTTVRVENVGEYLAYNVMIGLVDMTTRKPLEKLVRAGSKAPTTLAPKESMDVLLMPTEKYQNVQIEMNILYYNVMDETRQITFAKFLKANDFMLIRASTTIRQGLLLNSLEDLNLIYRLLRYTSKRTKTSK